MVLRLREPVNGAIHCLGALLAVVGLVLLLVQSAGPVVKPWHMVTFSIFGAALIGLYLTSTLYHWLPLAADGIRRMRKLDHTMIFVLIAATYTPVCLIPLRGPWGWTLFGIVWSIAILGTIFKLFWLTAPRWLSTTIYVGMGWVALVAIWPLVQTMEVGGLVWLAAGGLFYSVGAVIYGLKRPNPVPGWFGFHEIFHVFCVLGSASHFWMMYRYVALAG
jgi:hemolysin III